MVKLTCNGESSVILPKGEKLYAFTELDASLGTEARYAWQIITDTGRWATVSGYVFSYAIISDALLANAKMTDGTARVRCIVTVAEEKYVSDVLTVTFSDEAAAAPATFAMRSVSTSLSSSTSLRPLPRAEAPRRTPSRSSSPTPSAIPMPLPA